MFGDCHIHMVLDGVYYKEAIAAHRGHVRDDLIRRRLAACADMSISYLRDGGDAFGVCLRARQLAPEFGIEYRVPCAPLCLKGRYGAFIGVAFETLADYRELVAQVKKTGGDFIKLMISGIMDFNLYGRVTSEPLTAKQIRRLVDIAHGEGFAVMAHANGAQTVIDALEAGVDSIEHGAFMNDESVRALAESSAIWVPTLATVGNLIGNGRYPDAILSKILHTQSSNVAACARLGGTIALGSDAGAYCVRHAEGAADEYALLKRALGTDADAVLQRGEDEIRRRFRRDA